VPAILRVGLVVAAVVAMAAVVLPRDDAAGVPDAEGCPGSGALPRASDIESNRQAILCLLNTERAKHGLVPLRQHPLLELASQRHSDDMVRRKYYEHETPDGVDPQMRMSAVGYAPPWTGENLYTGTGTEATPVRALEGWMESPGHRANILRPEFTEVGVGIAYESPKRGVTGPGAVYTTSFGGN
jgi:uncharacterized protein YkwD